MLLAGPGVEGAGDAFRCDLMECAIGLFKAQCTAPPPSIRAPRGTLATSSGLPPDGSIVKQPRLLARLHDPAPEEFDNEHYAAMNREWLPA